MLQLHSFSWHLSGPVVCYSSFLTNISEQFGIGGFPKLWADESYPRSLWWLILHVILAKGCPDGWNKHYFWVCLGGCFWMRWVWFSRLSKDGWLTPSHMGNGNLLRAQTEQKGWREVTSLSPWVGSSIFCPWTLVPLALGPSDSGVYPPLLPWTGSYTTGSPCFLDLLTWTDFPGGSVGKESAHNARD